MYNELTELPNPFRGRKGILFRFSRIFYAIMGPAQVGIGRPEAPYAPPANPACPLCELPMSGHAFLRGDAHSSTRLICPGGK